MQDFIHTFDKTHLVIPLDPLLFSRVIRGDKLLKYHLANYSFEVLIKLRDSLGDEVAQKLVTLGLSPRL